jgi:hypothetical protein
MYTKDDVIGMLNKASVKGEVIVNSTVNEIFSYMDQEVEQLETPDDLTFEIIHLGFLDLQNKGFDFKFLFACETMTQLTAKIIKISKSHMEYGYVEEGGENKMKGDLFEIFAEIFFKLTSSDNRVGVIDYVPVDDYDDYGVDGTGTAKNGYPLAVQVKFRSNPTDILSIKDLKNFQGLAYKKHNVPVDQDENLIIFTNCRGIHWVTETNVMHNCTVTYGIFKGNSDHNLTNLIDGNNSFWTNVIKVVEFNS